jgi:FlaA1/EpsC-like NDP-sugar epimerase
MMESNASEAVRNNVLATNALAEIAGKSGVDVFVMISSDKAVRPTSVMGASKRVAELVIQDLDRRFETRYVAVRFGNVIGSTGSVIPIFREQIRRGGPVTVTHPDMVRYFMTIPEAAQLVLQAGTMGKGGEIFVLDMGQPVRILDLAQDTIALSGLRPYEDIDIVFCGVRPGEKLCEELDMADEHLTRTYHPKIFTGKIAAYETSRVHWGLEQLTRLAIDENPAKIYHFLQEFLPEASLTTSQTTAPISTPRWNLTPEIITLEKQTA